MMDYVSSQYVYSAVFIAQPYRLVTIPQILDRLIRKTCLQKGKATCVSFIDWRNATIAIVQMSAVACQTQAYMQFIMGSVVSIECETSISNEMLILLTAFCRSMEHNFLLCILVEPHFRRLCLLESSLSSRCRRKLFQFFLEMQLRQQSQNFELVSPVVTSLIILLSVRVKYRFQVVVQPDSYCRRGQRKMITSSVRARKWPTDS